MWTGPCAWPYDFRAPASKSLLDQLRSEGLGIGEIPEALVLQAFWLELPQEPEVRGRVSPGSITLKGQAPRLASGRLSDFWC